jgi:hypothetical protein
METEKYNGYKNRSTWLAIIHLDNTNLEVYNKAQELAIKYNEMIAYWEDIQKRDPASYSYPFHQHKAVEEGLYKLLNDTKIRDEVNYHFKDIDQKEVFNHFND